MRLDSTTLALLHSRATDGFAHAVDVMRLVEEVWALNDHIRTLEKTVALPDTARLTEFEDALREIVEDDLHALLRDPVVVTVRDTYARTPSYTLADCLAWLAVQLWRDKVGALQPPDDDTGEFVAVASVVATTPHPNDLLTADSMEIADAKRASAGVVFDYQGRRLVPTTDPADGVNVVVTDRGVMRYDPPVVGPTTGYADPTKTYVPQWDWKPKFVGLGIPDLLYLVNKPTPLSAVQYAEVVAELDRRGYKLGGSTHSTVSSNEPDVQSDDAPTIVES